MEYQGKIDEDGHTEMFLERTSRLKGELLKKLKMSIPSKINAIMTELLSLNIEGNRAASVVLQCQQALAKVDALDRIKSVKLFQEDIERTLKRIVREGQKASVFDPKILIGPLDAIVDNVIVGNAFNISNSDDGSEGNHNDESTQEERKKNENLDEG